MKKKQTTAENEAHYPMKADEAVQALVSFAGANFEYGWHAGVGESGIMPPPDTLKELESLARGRAHEILGQLLGREPSKDELNQVLSSTAPSERLQ